MRDVDVFPRDALDAEHAAQFDKPWLVQFEGGRIEQFDTEAEACARQRKHRALVGLGPMTGEPHA